MQTVSAIADLRARLIPARRAGQTIALVPTMGALHHGHMELVRRAREANDVVVASVFVNPLQFSPSEDFTRYPRDLARDSAMLAEGGVDFLFAPTVDDMYPRPMETTVDLPRLGAMLEGVVRPTHFAGVATVVAKLFNIVQPTRAYFGEKDYQQLQIIRRMVADLDMTVEIVGVPTVREPDGLAASSRNVYLTPEQRRAAPILQRSLAEAERLVEDGLRDAAALEVAVRAVLAGEPLARPEIVAVRDADTLDAVDELPARTLVMLSVAFGATRLIDERVIVTPAGEGTA
jgi:pantoate--beta-alanine ligase